MSWAYWIEPGIVPNMILALQCLLYTILDGHEERERDREEEEG